MEDKNKNKNKENNIKKNVSEIRNGLHRDNSFIEQPKGTLRYALNAVSETNEGDQTFISNENSNELAFSLSEDFIPLGKVYVGNNKTVIFSVKRDETLSEIGIVDENFNYETLIQTDLGFKLENQIDATFRLRRGEEKIIYWVDPKVRYFNINRPELFKISGSSKEQIESKTENWDINSFSLLKKYSSIPVFRNFKISEKGNLSPGSYNFSIQYLDKNSNPTEWIISTEPIVIYKDTLYTKNYKVYSNKHPNEISGNSNIKTDYLTPKKTNKSISFDLSNLDKNFSFYRIAIIEATLGNGEISSVKLSPLISINNKTFSYSGDNYVEEGTIEEIQKFSLDISEAKNIEQIENRLILGDVKYSNINFCDLQKYASKIKTEIVPFDRLIPNKYPRKKNITSLSQNPLIRLNNNGVSYTPGEIYSFGIVYIFENNVKSPVYHIPGKNPNTISRMSDDNKLTIKYTEDNKCTNYWGTDCEGDYLENTYVRHHRFPFKSELGYTYDKGLGISFQNITVPTVKGHKIIGYQIVQQERTEENMTILDEAILTPLTFNDKYISNSSFVYSSEIDISRKMAQKTFQIISPRYKFKGFKIAPTSIIQIGHFTVKTKKSSTVTEDVISGTSYDPEVHSKKEKDYDGFDLNLLNINHDCTRIDQENITYLVKENEDEDESNTIEKIFALDSLDYYEYTHENETYKIYNTNVDNKDVIIQLSKPFNNNITFTKSKFFEKIPIVVLKRDLENPYSNFRTDPYYPASSIKQFTRENNYTNLANGDSFLSNMNYFSSTFYDIRLKNRDKKSGFWNKFLGVLSVIGGSILIATGVGVATGIFAIGFGVSQVASGIKINTINNTLNKEYEKGLKEAVTSDYIIKNFCDIRVKVEEEDKIVDKIVSCEDCSSFQYGCRENPPNDDEIRWFSNLLKNIVFDSSIRFSLRNKIEETEVTDYLSNWNNNDNYFENIFLRIKTNDTEIDKIQQYFLNKLTLFDPDKQQGYLYKGYPNAEFYELNLDYERRDKSKIYFHLGLEYDCCVKNPEYFPNRIHYSEQSFQEDLSDSFQIFLPNNFRDIEGEKGIIRDIFKIQNNLYIHTDECLFHLPQNIQERVTQDVVSFIGTGGFFSIPPRKISDSEISSGGTLNKWSKIKTPYGVFFVSLLEGKIYHFTGNELNPISSNGLYHWFKNKINFKNNKYYNDNIDNPSNPLGLGYISTYDSEKERVLFTKKDFVPINLPNVLENEGDKIVNYNGDFILFRNYNETIKQKELETCFFQGLFEGKMRFKCMQNVGDTIQVLKYRYITETVTLNDHTDIHVILNITPNFVQHQCDNITLDKIINGECGTRLLSVYNAVNSFVNDYRINNPNWMGEVYYILDDSERWLDCLNRIVTSGVYGNSFNSNVLDGKDIFVMSFIDEAQDISFETGGVASFEQISSIESTVRHLGFINDRYNSFVENYARLNTFTGLLYPIVFPEGQHRSLGTKIFLLNTLSMFKGRVYTQEEVDSLERNTAFTESEWNHLKSLLLLSTPYSNFDLPSLNWILDSVASPDNEGNIITPSVFNNYTEHILEANYEENIIKEKYYETETVNKRNFNVVDIEGEIINFDSRVYNSSWTISYSLKNRSFTSWHSYTPIFYFNINNKFFSNNKGEEFYIHNVIGSHQKFYGGLSPFQLEYVSNSNPLINKIYEDISLYIIAEKYDVGNKEYIHERYDHFNGIQIYNDRQATSLLSFVDNFVTNQIDYLQKITTDRLSQVLIFDKEGIKTFNNFRNEVDNLNEPLLVENSVLVPNINPRIINNAKNWWELENLRGKFLVVRLTKNTFERLKVTCGYSVETESKSYR